MTTAKVPIIQAIDRGNNNKIQKTRKRPKKKRNIL
jgi:hypothetical protein